MLTAERLKRFAPKARADIIAALVQGWPAMQAAGINSALRLQHFLARAATETGGFTALEENLNYSAERLMAVWPKRFPTLAAAKPFARNPQLLANKVYGGRMGNKGPNDGWTYRGSGILQTTGRDNFREAGFEANPDDLRTPEGGLKAAIIFWTKRACNRLADKDNATAICEVVNGGRNGLDEQIQWLAKAKKIFVADLASRPMGLIASAEADDDEPDDPPRAFEPPEDAEGLDAKPLTDEATIRHVWAALDELNYTPGLNDGQLGQALQGAILSFRNNNALPLVPVIDGALLVALPKAGPKPVSDERAKSKPQGSRILSGAGKLLTGSLTAGGAGALANADDLLSKAEQANGTYHRVSALLEPLRSAKQFLDGAISSSMVIVVVAILVGFLAWRIRAARIEDHRTGKL